jgi:NAD(P)-dependent dehydrogenase (short-subunit alcohol dehydrogenase family)
MRSIRKRVLVTGGAGFLGSHLCERLVAGGDDVLCVDNYFTGRKENVAALLPLPQFEAMRYDITHPLFVEVDEIYNLVSNVSKITHLCGSCCIVDFVAPSVDDRTRPIIERRDHPQFRRALQTACHGLLRHPHRTRHRIGRTVLQRGPQ